MNVYASRLGTLQTSLRRVGALCEHLYLTLGHFVNTSAC